MAFISATTTAARFTSFADLKAKHESKCGRGLAPRWRWFSYLIQWLTHCYRGQAPSHIWTTIWLDN
ncbi:hypothetical protein EJD88_01405 [Pseudomonas sp. PB105]|nr:hypothetical protein EJD88_01405 [Pseudomonas sp. PB105]MVW94196.1 hypothetical protein [Pseudomonas sp. PB100]